MFSFIKKPKKKDVLALHVEYLHLKVQLDWIVDSSSAFSEPSHFDSIEFFHPEILAQCKLFSSEHRVHQHSPEHLQTK